IEGRNVKLLVVLNRGILKHTLPALCAHPAVKFVIPLAAVRVNAVDELEGRRIELENREIAELVSVGIEKLVVVDGAMLAENPFAIGIQVSLRRTAFDSVQEFVLALIRVWQVELIGKKECA